MSRKAPKVFCDYCSGPTQLEADNWCPLGLTDEHWGYGWNSRKGRRDQRLSKKMRWFRTP